MPSTTEITKFWEKTRAQLSEVPLDAAMEPVEGWADRTLTAYRIIMTSLENIKIRAWYFVPNGTPPKGGWPAVMEVPSGRGDLILPGYLTRFGYASLCLFPRGQGESKHEWVLEGDTGKLEFRLLHNITDPYKYYYRYADADCFRGLDFLESRPEIDATRLAIWGASQGGGFSLTTASLDDRIKTCIARLPWMCDMVAYSIWDKPPRDELYKYLNRNPQHREQAMETLAYFDNLNLVDRITCPTLVSGARLDPVHPYHTVKSAFDKIPPLKSILVYRDASGPEAGACNADFNRHAMDWLERYLR